MADPSSIPESARGAADHADGASAPAMPRWVKVFGTIILVLVLLFVVLRLTGLGGQHGPARHGAAAFGGAAPRIDGAAAIARPDPSAGWDLAAPRA